MYNNISLLNLRVVQELVLIGWGYKKERKRSIGLKPDFRCKPGKKMLEAVPKRFWRADRNVPYYGKAEKRNSSSS